MSDHDLAQKDSDVSLGKASVEHRILSAAARCAAKAGLDNMLIDDVVREAGVSRATIYRRFGNREGMLRAMIIEQAQPYVKRAAEIATGSGSIVSRIEEIIVTAIMSFNTYAWSPFVFERGASRATLALLVSIGSDFGDGALKTLIRRAAADGHLRPKLPLDRIHDWLLRQMVLANEVSKGSEPAIRTEVGLFIMPVLLPDQRPQDQDDDIGMRLQRIEAMLEERLPPR